MPAQTSDAWLKATGRPAIQEARLAADPRSDFDSALLRLCCGNLVAPRLAEIRRPEGRTVFVAAWYCPTCNRITV